MPRRSSERRAVAATDSLLGLLLVVAGILAVAAGILDLLPSFFALTGACLVAGTLTMLGAFVGRTQAGFWVELVPGGLLLALGVVLVRYPPADAAGLAPLIVLLFLAGGLVKLGAAYEFPSLSTIFLVGAAASLVMGALVLLEVRPLTIAGVSILLGLEVAITGLTAMVVSRADHPSKRG